MKEYEKIDKYFNLPRKMNKLWNMKTTVIPTVVCALGTVPKSLERILEQLKIRERLGYINYSIVRIG